MERQGEDETKQEDATMEVAQSDIRRAALELFDLGGQVLGPDPARRGDSMNVDIHAGMCHDCGNTGHSFDALVCCRRSTEILR